MYSLLLTETMATLIRILEPTTQEFSLILQNHQTHGFTEVSPLQFARITEIILEKLFVYQLTRLLDNQTP